MLWRGGLNLIQLESGLGGVVLVLVYVDVRTNDPHLDSPLAGGRIVAILGRKCINQSRMEKFFHEILSFNSEILFSSSSSCSRSDEGDTNVSPGERCQVDGESTLGFKKTDDSKTTTITITTIQQQLKQ